jgi:hypothetical protein
MSCEKLLMQKGAVFDETRAILQSRGITWARHETNRFTDRLKNKQIPWSRQVDPIDIGPHFTLILILILFSHLYLLIHYSPRCRSFLRS